MTARDISELNQEWLQSDKLGAVIDPAYKGESHDRFSPFASVESWKNTSSIVGSTGCSD